MADVFDYLEWRGDLSFENDPPNEIDGVIFAELVYLDFQGIISPELKRFITLSKAAEIYKNQERHKARNTGDLVKPELHELLYKAAATKRFGSIRLSGLDMRQNVERDLRFCGVTFNLNDNIHFIAFRGTDDTLVGWREDFKLAILDTVPSQVEALKYIRRCNGMFPEGEFYMSGHSKGGNLAVYAAVQAERDIQSRIKHVWNYDGPGFKKSIRDTEGYIAIQDRIDTILPESSVVGLLLEHQDDYKVVLSGLNKHYQHDAFGWDVRGAEFVSTEISKEFQLSEITLKRFLDSLSLDDRVNFMNAVFDILMSNENRTITDIKDTMIKSVFAMIKTYSSMDENSRKAITETIGSFFSEGFRSFKEMRKGINEEQ